MDRRIILALLVLPVVGIGTLAMLLWPADSIAILDPKGLIAAEQYRLIVVSTLLMLVVVIPVFIMTFFISWKYRAGNTKARYTPDWDHSRVAESLWWGIPSVIIMILAVIIWKSSHDLDPFKPIASSQKALTIQVVALPWKWLFIYPDQQIATVNYVRFPEDTPVQFQITADAPMNSFWIPQLGGQVYAMAGMSTRLHLIADEPGIYAGSSANLSGKGFAGMRFTAESTSRADFEQWVETVRSTPLILDSREYEKLSRPSENEAARTYSAAAAGLYDTIMKSYMMPSSVTVPAPAQAGHAHSKGAL